jgi:DNA-binding transcriptional LysR family regulator
MRIEQFEQFIALANHQHFRKAAQASGISTSALTRSIQTLEQDLDCELFARSTRSVKLTIAGNVFLNYCQQVLENHSLLKQKIAKLNYVQNEKIVIGYSPDTMSLVPQICGKFMQNFPKISIEMQLQDTDGLMENVKNGYLDLAISSKVTTASYASMILPEQILLFCHKDHPLANLTPLSMAQLAQYPLLATLNSNQSIEHLINQVATSLGQLNALCHGTFEQISHKLNDMLHIGLTSFDGYNKVNNNEQLINLTAHIECQDTPDLELQITENKINTPIISELANFFTQQTNAKSNIVLSNATF